MKAESRCQATRADRNAALVEVMLLAAMADGGVSPAEMQTLLRRVLERPEFEGTNARGAQRPGGEERAAPGLPGEGPGGDPPSLRDAAAGPQEPDARLRAGRRGGLRGPAGHAATELGLLKTFQAALGISEDEVAQIIDVIEQGGSLAEALGEPLERLYAEVMVLVTAADGKLKEAEARALVESFAADPLFQDVEPRARPGAS